MEDRPTEIQRPPDYPPEPPLGPGEPPPGPPPGAPPPWYREYWWIWLVVLLLIVGGIIAFFALRDSGDGAETQTTGPPKVPNVIGTQEQFARTVLEEDGFEVEVVRQPSDQRTGVVFEQRPEAGSKLAQGSTVRIAVSTGPPPTQTVTQTETETAGPSGESGESGPETVNMPDVTGKTHVNAVNQLVDLGVFPDSIPMASSEDRGTVVAQQPSEGEKVALGSSVRVDISLGSGDREDLEVPDFMGMDAGDALKACAKARFACRTIAAGPKQKDVVGQEPAAGSMQPELTIINVLTGS
jgi:eukaryotic-like serine/threonine-protein kinase